MLVKRSATDSTFAIGDTHEIFLNVVNVLTFYNVYDASVKSADC